MKIREMLDRLDEISRRDFLKGAGAAALGATGGYVAGRACKSEGILLNISSGGTGRSSEKRKQKRSFARAGWNWDLI